MRDSMTEFYQSHLDRVSRSFAFCIRELREPMRHRVALAYLLFRILDTVEDAPAECLDQKLSAMDAFDSFISSSPAPIVIKNWISSISTKISEGEKTLLRDANLIFEDFHRLPNEQRHVMKEALLNMSRGMRHFLKQSAAEGGLKLKHMGEVNGYCFFVAGIVGEMLSKILASLTPDFKITAETLKQAHQFGLFLQKINILKDQLEDESAGRFLVPSQSQMWCSLQSDADGAIAYLLSVPAQEKGYRTFCAWSLFLGLGSIPWIKKSWATKVMDKIPRILTQRLLTEVTGIVDDNAKLLDFYEKMKPRESESHSLNRVPSENPTKSTFVFPEFTSLYTGNITDDHLQSLGMVGF